MFRGRRLGNDSAKTVKQIMEIRKDINPLCFFSSLSLSLSFAFPVPREFTYRSA